MSDEQAGPADLAAQLAALAAQHERLERAVNRAEQRAALNQADAQAAAARLQQAEEQATQLRAGLTQAETGLTAIRNQLRRPAPPALSWLDPIPGPPGGPPGPTPEEILEDLVEWLQAVYVRLDGPYPLPACWAFHPGVVEVLLTLRMAHAEVYSSRGNWEKALTWQIRSRPDTAKKISEWIGVCEIRQHAAGGPLYQGTAPEVPLAGFLEEVAAVWDARRETPDPTQLVIAAADRYVNRQRATTAA